MSLFGNSQYRKKESPLTQRQKSSGKNHNKKFQELYENYKTQKTKEELFRQKMISEREKNELKECYFSPRLSKSKNIFNKKPFEGITQEERNNNKLKTKELLNIDSNVVDLIDRQSKWLENKNKKLNHKIVEEAIKTVEGCVFKPEIKKVNKKVVSNLKIESNKIVEKPDSYINFIKRNKKCRENKKKINNIYEYPVTKNRKSPYKNKMLKNNDYDYTKHELTENSYLLKNKSSANYSLNISNNLSNKSFKEKEIKTIKSIPISKLKITNISNDELYSMIYLSEKEKIEKNVEDYTEENIKKIFGNQKQINFRQAMDALHNTLINLNLSDDSDNEVCINEREN